MPKPEEMLDIIDIQTVIASRGGKSGVGFRLFLRDGTSLQFVLTDDQASGLATEVECRLAAMREKPPGGRTH